MAEQTALAAEIINFRFGAIDHGLERRLVNEQGSDETCTLVPKAEGHWAIQSPDGQQWVSIQPDGSISWRLVSDPTQPGPWETFTRAGNVLTELPKDGVTRALVQFLVKGGSSAPGPQPPAGSISRLSLNGSDLVNAAGQRTFLRGSNSFTAFEEWLLSGEARLKPVAEELRAYRVNCARVWSMNVNVNNFDLHRPPFDPRRYPNYYSELRPFTQFWASYGIWLYWGIFPDVQLINSDLGWQQAHWDQMKPETDQEEGTFAYEFQNEPASKDYNKVTFGFNHRSPDRPWTGASYSPDDGAYHAGTFPTAAWNSPMGDLHPARVYPAQILDSNPANNVYVTHNKGLIIGEGDRFGEGGNPNARQAEQVANATRACAIGTILHTNKGKWAMRLDSDPTTKTCADRYFGGFGAI